MSKASKGSAVAVAAATLPPFRPSSLPVDSILEQAYADALLPTFVQSTLNSLVHASIERLYHAGIERAAEQYVAQQAVADVLSVVEWQLLEPDEGEEKWISGWEGMTAADEAERQRHLWTAEDEPLPATIDRWARHVLPVSSAHESEVAGSQQWSLADSEADVTAASAPDSGAPQASPSAAFDSTAPFSVMSASTTSPVTHTRPSVSHFTQAQRLPSSPAPHHLPRPSSTASVSSPQPAGIGTTLSASSVPYPLPSASPPAASEQQRLARMATLRQQQAEMAEKKKKEKERVAEEERRREEEKAKERALMSARRQKAAALHSARLPASDTASQPRKRPTQASSSQHEEKQQLPDASPTTSPSSSPPSQQLPALPAARRFTQSAKPKRGHKQAVDDATVDGYTNAAALMASIVKAFVPAPGVRLLYGSEIKAGPEVGGGGGGDGRGRGVSVEDEQWVSVVRGMNRSQYMRWMDEQRAQAAKEADIQLRQHSLAAPSHTQQPAAQHLSPRRAAMQASDEADQQSTTVQPAIRVRPSERVEQEEKQQLTARAPVVLQPRVVTRERRTKDMSFDSRIIADNTWGSNNSVAQRDSEARGPAYDLLERDKSSTAVKERKAVVSVPRKARQAKAVVGKGSAIEKKFKVGGSSSAGQVKLAGDKHRVAALLQLGKGREQGRDAADGDS